MGLLPALLNPCDRPHLLACKLTRGRSGTRQHDRSDARVGARAPRDFTSIGCSDRVVDLLDAPVQIGKGSSAHLYRWVLEVQGPVLRTAVTGPDELSGGDPDGP